MVLTGTGTPFPAGLDLGEHFPLFIRSLIGCRALPNQSLTDQERRLAAARVTGHAGPAASLPLPPARSRSACPATPPRSHHDNVRSREEFGHPAMTANQKYAGSAHTRRRFGDQGNVRNGGDLLTAVPAQGASRRRVEPTCVDGRGVDVRSHHVDAVGQHARDGYRATRSVTIASMSSSSRTQSFTTRRAGATDSPHDEAPRREPVGSRQEPGPPTAGIRSTRPVRTPEPTPASSRGARRDPSTSDVPYRPGTASPRRAARACSDRNMSAGARVQNGLPTGDRPPTTDHRPCVSSSVLNATPADRSASGVRL